MWSLNNVLLDIFPGRLGYVCAVLDPIAVACFGLLVGYFFYFGEKWRTILRRIFYGVISALALAVFSLLLLILYGLYRDGRFAMRLPANARLSDANLLAGNLSTAPITTEELVAFGKSYVDKDKLMFKDIIIGNYNGHPVRVSYPCADICPTYTIRIIRYDLPNRECAAAGGEVRSIYVPCGPAVSPKEFCFPKPLVDGNIYEFIGG